MSTNKLQDSTSNLIAEKSLAQLLVKLELLNVGAYSVWNSVNSSIAGPENLTYTDANN